MAATVPAQRLTMPTARLVGRLITAVVQASAVPSEIRTDQEWQPAGWAAPAPTNGVRTCGRSARQSKHPLIPNRGLTGAAVGGTSNPAAR